MLIDDGLSILFLTGVLGVLTVWTENSQSWRVQDFGAISGLALGIGFAASIFVARRSRRIRPFTDRPAKAGVLLLRSFHDDMFTTIPKRTVRLMKTIRTTAERFTPEQRLASLLRQFGPIVSISAPGETKRLDYVQHVETVGDWRDNVRELMREVQIVVLRYDANDSSGFWWEVKELIAGGIPPTRVLAWFPQDHHIPFDMFQVHFKELMPVTFPSTPDRQVQFVFFDEKWKPHLVIRGPKFLRWIAPVIDFDAFYFDSQLSPFFEQNQQSPPRLALRQTVIVGGAMLLSTALWVLFMTMPA